MTKFSGTQQQPYHLSVGAVLLNDQNQILCHHFFNFHQVPEGYILMRETIEDGESLEQAVARGLMEEFGATAEIQHFLGSIKSQFNLKTGEPVEKTTLYFQCKLISQDINLRANDAESGSQLEWKSKDELIEGMRQTSANVTWRTDLDESTIVERVQI